MGGIGLGANAIPLQHLRIHSNAAVIIKCHCVFRTMTLLAVGICKEQSKAGVVAHIPNPSNQEAKEGGSL